MRMNRIAALTLGAGMITMAACSDSPTAPTAAAVKMPTTSFDIGDVTDGPAPEASTGVIIVCKTGNVGGSFTFGRTTEGSEVDPNGGVAADQDIDTGKCLEVARDDSPSGSGSHITITEAPADNTVQTITACRFRGYALDGVTLNPPEDCVYANGGDLFLNHFHGYVITYNNEFTPPSTGCTYTKGWYQSKNATLTGVDGLTTTMEAAFFAATPNKTGSVSFVGPNNLLNLYQQLLAALENQGAKTLPADVQDAIDDAQAGTSVSGGGELTTTLTNTEISALIATLSGFNEGSVTGWPHCD